MTTRILFIFLFFIGTDIFATNISTIDTVKFHYGIQITVNKDFSKTEEPAQQLTQIDSDTTNLKDAYARLKELYTLIQMKGSDTTELKENLAEAVNIIWNLIDNDTFQNDSAFSKTAYNIIKSYNDNITSLEKLDSDSPIVEIYERLFGTQEKIDFNEEHLFSNLLPKTEIPMTIDKVVKMVIKHYCTIHRPNFERYLHRAQYYFPIFERIIEEEDVPKEMVYLSIIESGVNPKAKSRASALGTWQFMKPTGRLFGLYGNQWFDERMDIEKSTRASMRYLKELHDRYDDWHLALTSYNAGFGRVNRGIKYSHVKDLSKIGKYLRRESREYVPRYIAAAIIAMNPEKFGFKPMQFFDSIPKLQIIIDGMISLDTLGKYIKVSKEELVFLNPELLRETTPPAYRYYKLYVPLEKKSQIDTLLSTIPDSVYRYYIPYKIKKPDNIINLIKSKGISQVKLKEIKEINNLKTEQLQKRQMIVLPVTKDEFVNYENNMSEMSDDTKEKRIRLWKPKGKTQLSKRKNK